MLNQAAKYPLPIGTANLFLASPFRMGHQGRNVLGLVADAGDYAHGSIGIGMILHGTVNCGVLPKDLSPGLHLLNGGSVCKITTFPVRNGNPHQLPFGNGFCERGIVVDSAEVHKFRPKL